MCESVAKIEIGRLVYFGIPVLFRKISVVRNITRKMYRSSNNISDNQVVEIGDHNFENEHPDYRKPNNKLKRGRR